MTSQRLAHRDAPSEADQVVERAGAANTNPEPGDLQNVEKEDVAPAPLEAWHLLANDFS